LFHHRPARWATRIVARWPMFERRGGVALAAMPRSARYVGQVEWASSPMNMRIDAYYLSMCSRHRHWVLWLKGYDDNWSEWMAPQVVAAAPRCGLDAGSAAKLLLAHYWDQERENQLDAFHWVNSGGILDAGELNEVAVAAWGSDE